MSKLQDPDFHIDATVQSQYAGSEHIRKLVDTFWEALNPDADLELLYNKMINPETAVGFGLEVWGRIVAMGRTLTGVLQLNDYFAFEPFVENDRMKPFNIAPWYTEIKGKYRLSDSAYRVAVFIKALINISDGSLASINRMFATLFPNRLMYVIKHDTMVLRVVFDQATTEDEKALILALPWVPAGVGLDIYQVITPTFGFDGSELQPFGQGTFGL